ncbi:MAG: ParA family protein [Solirubrobacteraceae bacterium]
MAAELTSVLGTFFSGDVLPHGASDRRKTGVNHIFGAAWQMGQPVGDTGGTARLLDRRRSKEAWYKPALPPWGLTEGPPIVTFASYKGGFGRSTALAAAAVGFAEEGLRVLAVDLDLEAPGLWSLLPPQHAGDRPPTPESGLVDVLLDPAEVQSAVYPAHERPNIDVLPAGAVDSSYLEKLARIDYEALVSPDTADGPLPRALVALRQHRPYDLVLLDARAGLHDLTGAAVNGTPHLAVLFGRDTDESWAGIALMLRRIGADRVGTESGQQDVLLVYAKAPGEVANASDVTYADALARFESRALHLMLDEEAYYARASEVGPDDADLVESDDRHHAVGLLFDRDTLHGDGRRIPVDRLGYAELRAAIRERVGLRG